MILALAPEETSFWEVSLAIGAVVIIVVIALLGLLLYLVRSIESAARRLLLVVGTVGENTGHIKVALTVADTLDEVTDEAIRHAQLLGVRL